jgi:hypothetical protein
MNALVAHGSVVGGDAPVMLIWFVLFFFGVLFIALALRDDRRNQSGSNDTIRNLQDLRDHPLRNVHEAIRPKRTRPASTEERPKPRSPHHRTTGPRGIVR